MARKRAKKAYFLEAIANFLLDFGIYAFAVVGVLTSKYITEFRAGSPISFETLGLPSVIIACVIAFIVSFGMDIDGDTEGLRKNWKRRAAFALSSGIAWYTIVGG